MSIRKHLIGYTSVALAAGSIGILATSAQAAPAPAPTVATAPKECLDALKQADAAFEDVVGGFEAASDLVTALSEFDDSAAEEANGRLEYLSNEVGRSGNAYRTAAIQCRRNP